MIKISGPNRILIAKKKKNNLRIFVDIDGVCSNWMKSACHVCEIDEKNKKDRKILKETGKIENLISEENLWERINKQGQKWWANLEILPWAKELYEKLNKETKDFAFLSSPSNEPSCVAGKREWIKKHFDTKNFIFTSQKHLCATKNSLLIDDDEKNCEKFEEYGGKFFLWPREFVLLDKDIDVDDTIEDLMSYIKELKNKINKF